MTQQAREFTELVLAHRGKRIAVMGGAPTLADHLEQVKADVWISANHHGIQLRPADYVLCMDDHVGHIDRRIQPFIRQWSDAPIISPDYWADYQLVEWPKCPAKLLSGMVAAWAAWAMGASVVILAGMDGYNGSGNAMNIARRMAEDIRCPVRVVGGGPLCQVWEPYDPAEKFGRYKPHGSIDALLKRDGATQIEVLKPVTIRGGDREKGQIMSVMRHEVMKLIRHRIVREV